MNCWKLQGRSSRDPGWMLLRSEIEIAATASVLLVSGRKDALPSLEHHSTRESSGS